MMALLESGRTPLLENFISKKGRPFSAFLVKQPDGKIGFEFEERDATKGKSAAARKPAGALRILGKHPEDGAPISVYAGRFGPYVKHGDVNATIREKDKADTITLEEALELLAEKGGVPVAAKKRPAAKAGTKTTSKKTATAARAGTTTAVRKRKAA
jgi:topoisomerase IA-like protein